jgi:hypothetical protein
MDRTDVVVAKTYRFILSARERASCIRRKPLVVGRPWNAGAAWGQNGRVVTRDSRDADRTFRCSRKDRSGLASDEKAQQTAPGTARATERRDCTQAWPTDPRAALGTFALPTKGQILGDVPRVFLPEFGFREAGVRSARSVTEGALKLIDLVAAPDGTDLVYELTHDAPPTDERRAHESVVVRNAGTETELSGGTVAVWSKNGVWRRAARSRRAIPVAAGPVEVDVALSGLGEWRVSGELVPFGLEAEAIDVEASDTHEGITVTLRWVSISGGNTAVEISASASEKGVSIDGIGASSQMRLGPCALTLRDEALRVYAEQPHDMRHDNRPYDHETLAVFPPLPPDARRLELEVPFVFVSEPYEQATFELPVSSPQRISFGRYPATVVRTFLISDTGQTRPGRRGGPGIGVDIDLGDWHGSRRVLMPRQLLLDGASAHLRYTSLFDTRNPEPVEQFAVAVERPEQAARLTLLGARVQVRGPWTIRFER